MNSIETDVYNKVKTGLGASFTGLKIDTVEDYSPESFPSVQIFEADNSTDKESIDSSGTEKFTNVMYEVCVWTEGNGRKNQAKKIISNIDSTMVGLGFARISYATLVTDKTVFRIVARYDAKIGVKNNIYTIYRR